MSVEIVFLNNSAKDECEEKFFPKRFKTSRKLLLSASSQGEKNVHKQVSHSCIELKLKRKREKLIKFS